MAKPTADPHYLRIKTHLKEGMASGRWEAGDLLPSEGQLTMRFKISRMTANRALRELEQEGLIERVQGVGSFVAQLHRAPAVVQVREVADVIAAHGGQHDWVVQRTERARASAQQAAELGLKRGAPVFVAVVVHRDGGVPLQVETLVVNPQVAPDFLGQDFSQQQPAAYLQELAPLSSSRTLVEAALPSEDDARWLAVPRRSPCLVVRRIHYSRGVAVATSRWVHPGARLQLHGVFGAGA
ncbi:UTRA domain-containing protein [Roseateles sp.]|uniref:UTRA domain-containing protein n=1 Tax=Roseateles sp. TaxID=1971397 RepID=UPI0039457057